MNKLKTICFYSFVMCLPNSPALALEEATPPAQNPESCAKPLEKKLSYTGLRSVIETIRSLGPQSGFVVMSRAGLNEVELRKSLQWLKDHDFMSGVDDLPGQDIKYAQIYLLPSQLVNANLFVEINKHVRLHTSGVIEKTILMDIKAALKVAATESATAFQIRSRLGWDEARLMKALQWLVDAQILKTTSIGRLDLGDYFYIQPSLGMWTKLFDQWAVADEIE